MSRRASQAQVHDALIRTLRDFDAACKRLGITYWIDSGTLLGAVRHGGMIPWDDDIDVCMPREDVDRFLKAGIGCMGDRYSVHSPSDDPRIAVSAKVYINGTHVRSTQSDRLGLPPEAHDGLSLDVVVMDRLAATSLNRRFDRALSWLVGTHVWASDMARSPAVTGGKRLRWAIAAMVPNRLIQILDTWLEHRIRRYDGALLGVGVAARFNGFAYPRSVVFPLTTMGFAGLDVPAPADPDSYLMGMFGPSFVTPPPLEQRVPHASKVLIDDDVSPPGQGPGLQ